MKQRTRKNARATTNHWYALDYYRFPAMIGPNRHYGVTGLVVILANWHAGHHDGLREPIPGDYETLAHELGIESQAEHEHLRYVIDRFCTVTRRGKEKRLTVDFVEPVLKERDRIRRIRRKSGEKGGRPPNNHMVSKRLANANLEQNRTEQKKTERERTPSARALTLSERGSLLASLSEEQRAELRRKGCDPAAWCGNFEAKNAGERLTERGWKNRVQHWVNVEKGPAVRPTLAAIAARTPAQIAQAQELARQGEAARDRITKNADEELARRLAAVTARQRGET